MSIFLPVLSILVLVIGIPIGYWLGIVSIPGIWEMGGWPFMRILATRYHSAVEEFLLIAVPFFILSGELMNRAGLTDRLIRWVNQLLGHFAGGLSHVTIGASIIFAGMTGAAVTDCVAIGNILIPGMKRDGYPAPYATAAWEAWWPILVVDAKHAEDEARRLGTPASRRTAFRTLFSCLEAAMWVQRLLPLAVSKDARSTYTAEELALLKEEQYILTPDGTPKTTKRFLRIEENLLFTIRMVAKLEDVDPDIDLTSEGWRSLKDSVRVRNRVTHPRSEHDLDVSEEEFERLVIAL